ncbi:MULTISPECIES: FAD-binding protein [Prochlorococcus]|uniref:Succinate dehydrogenase flavoprotein subunit n=1 Tax=Prochlorococcus marinus str. MIT 9314 TaxID=167548 RepID=A0A0A2AEJ1_PROMR|nr:FAD-binding protein [Prochlorococcus marinus]KGG00298.1 Succinate dehydrogenase flavoprotein subunit [Prochlorococcus marinus str. MIT 9314]
MDNNTDSTDILVIGCGGSGLRAAIEAKQNNLTVKVLGKRSKNDSHTVLAAGGINASFGNLDFEDSWEQHFADTYLEGYEIGDPAAIELMARNAPDSVKEIDSWGANFKKLYNGKFDQRYFGAHTFRRTCFSGDYTGKSILNALLQKASLLDIQIHDSEYVTDLLISENKCFGAMSFDIFSGERTIHLANAVILCTGGHTRIWKKSSSRKMENTGDGLFLGLKSGCELIDMEMVQFHPTGMLFPEDIEGTLVTEAVRGEGGRLFNAMGERFMKNYDIERLELSTRDLVAKANYTEIQEGRGTVRGGVLLDISHIKKDTIISRIPSTYKQFLEFQNIDISKTPMEVAPTAHYSMGGISVKAASHSTDIEGLFAAGEVAGGLHGANRLGGNSLAEILVFGKIAGAYASKYSKSSSYKDAPLSIIKSAHENIEKKLKKGSEDANSLQNQLRDLMWEHCGVVKKRESLKEGLNKINILKNKLMHICIRENNICDLIKTFDIEASLMTAEATILSALTRNESRGAHNRDDYPRKDKKGFFNTKVKLKDNKLEIRKSNLNKPSKELLKIIKETKEINNFSDKLLE